MCLEELIVESFNKSKIEAKQEAYKEVLGWLEENFFTGEIEGYYNDVPEHIVQGKFDCKEEMLQSFKERFNVE